MELKIYYFAYFFCCAALVAALTFVFHRSGGVLLRDVFRGETSIVRAVTRLMDVGFYLISLGYICITLPTYVPQISLEQVLTMAGYKLGFFLLILGAVHLFNLLLLILLRRRGGQARVSELC